MRRFRGELALAVVLSTVTASPARAADREADHTADAHYQAGAKAFDESDFAHAIEELSASVAARPSLKAHLLRGDAEVKLSRVDEARADYEAALQLSPPPRTRVIIERSLRDLATAAKTRLRVTSEPPGANVFIDMKADGARGVTPVAILTAPGRHRVFVELAGYEPFAVRDVEVAGDKETPLAVKLVVQGCDLSVAASPAGATVAIDGAAPQPAPLTVRVRGGEHLLAFARPGSLPRQSRVTCVVGKPLHQEVKLDEEPPGRVLVELAGPAELRLDGRKQPGPALTVAPGEHTVRVEGATSEPWQTRVRVDSGQEIRLAPSLTPKRSGGSKAWLWAGIGVAVVGVAVGLGVGLGLGLSGSDLPSGRLGSVRVFGLSSAAGAR